MEENKNINDLENTETTEITEITETEAKQETKKAKISVKELLKSKKPKKIKNDALLKKGSYSLAVTAIVLAGLIVLNILVGALSKRVPLDFDFSSDKKSSLSEENIKYLKNVDRDVKIIFCADDESYESYMSYYAQQYGVQSGGQDYYKQTLKMVKKYADYNGKIDLEFVDPQTSDFSKISSKYSGEQIAYGDIIVTAEKNGTERHKIVKFTDIYSLESDETYAAYGVSSSNITGNNIENALTGAVSYALSNKDKKIAFITGHSSDDNTADYKSLLSDNNYKTEEISDKVVKKISKDYDAVVIAAPSTDFMAEELSAISEFLDNDSKLGKGLIFFADARAPYLTNLYDFLDEWGISVEEGVLFETDENNHMPDEPTTIGSFDTGEDKITSDMQLFITGENVPFTASFQKRDSMSVTALASTPEPETCIAAPKGSNNEFKDAGSYEKKSYKTVLQSEKLDYGEDNEELKSYVMAFSSQYFLSSQYNEMSGVSNKNLTLALTDRACGVENSDISFVTKSIANESFAESVTQAKSNLILIIFMILLPLAMIATGIYVFIKRKNA